MATCRETATRLTLTYGPSQSPSRERENRRRCSAGRREDINVVIGRLSDLDNDSERCPHWTRVREAQVKFADSDSRYAWVDTDDLNGPKDDLHDTKRGYRILGRRFAERAIELLEKNRK